MRTYDGTPNVADDAGALLVRSGLVSASALDDARARVDEVGGTIGEQLVATGLVSDDALTDFYRSRLLVPQVNPNTLGRLATKIVGVIPNDMAIELRVVPVSLDDDNNLTVAMSDPSDRHAVDEIAFFTGAYVVRAVATQMQIAWCLAHYYGHVTNLGQRLLRADTPAAEAPEPATTARPRQRGITGEVEAMRHRGLVPGEARIARDERSAVVADEPTDDRNDELASEPGDEAVDEAGDEAVDEAGDEAADKIVDDTVEKAPGEPAGDGHVRSARARSISGEIRANRRAPSIRPIPEDSGPVITMEADERQSGPEITIEAGSFDSADAPVASERDDDTVRVLPAPPRRRRPAEPDPPELAARAGEVDLKVGLDREIGSGPSIVIDDALEREAVPEHVMPGTVAGLSRARSASGEIAIQGNGLREVSGEIAVSFERESLASRANISVEISDEDSSPVMIHESLHPARIEDEPSAPILLDRKRPSDPPVNRDAPESAPDGADRDDEIVELAARKPAIQRGAVAAQPRRADRRTEVGIGVVGSRPKHDTVEAIPAQLEDDPTGEHKKLAGAIERAIDIDPTRVDRFAAPTDGDAGSDPIAAPPAPIRDDDTSPIAAPPRPRRGSSPRPQRAAAVVPPPSGRVELTNVQRASRAPGDDDDDADRDIHGGKPTVVMPALVLAEEDDEDWGAPGTTIPPPFLGAIPGSMEPRFSGIPLPDVDSQPLMVAPPSPPEHARPHSTTEAGVARALEQATMRVLDLIRDLEHAQDRDEVVAVMTAHLSETHRRAGFFAVRGGELSLFSITPNVVPLPWQTLKLDRPSTLGDVVGTRLPYRGPMHDHVSRAFLEDVLGVCPPEILLVPITVRERVVGVLFGEHRMRHTFDDQLALASRAAGDALERILRAKRA